MSHPFVQLPTLYQGSVKDVLGPLGDSHGKPGVVFDYSDAFSVFDWGKMPDSLSQKGEALAITAAYWLERLAKPEAWVEFSRSPEALKIRKANRFGARFNELGERLQKTGLRTHYLSTLMDTEAGQIVASQLDPLEKPVRRLWVKQVTVQKPRQSSVLGRSVPDYTETRTTSLPRLVPLEVIFRFSVPEGSSLISRMAQDPSYLVSRGFNVTSVQEGMQFDFPVLELFSKLEDQDRPLPLSEALAIAGLQADQLEELLFSTAWVAAFLRADCARHGLDLADGKLEWALDEHGQVMLVDAIGPDELRILKEGVQLSKEFLRHHYRTTAWYAAITRAKEQAEREGVREWRRFVKQSPPALPSALKELASQIYLSLTNTLTGRTWFPNAWSMEQVIREMQVARANGPRAEDAPR